MLTEPITTTDTLLERTHIIPNELAGRRQWVTWRDEKGSKIPYQAQRPKRRAKVNDPATWADFTEAVQTFADWLGDPQQFTGIGYVFTDSDGLVGVDLDDCVNGDEIDPKALAIVCQLGGYAEISPSMTGIKVWTKAQPSTSGKKTRGPWGGFIEVYGSRRWFALTGWEVDNHD